jgi:hypothetical protein
MNALRNVEGERLKRSQVRQWFREAVSRRLTTYISVAVDANDDLTHEGRRVHCSPALLAAAVTPGNSLSFLSFHEKESVWQRLQWECVNFLTPEEQRVCQDPQELSELLRVSTIRRLLRESRLDAPTFWQKMEDGVIVQRVWSHVARMLLAIPASTAPSERVFSSTGFFDKRARGQSTMVPLLAFIRANVPLLSHSAHGQVAAVLEEIDGIDSETDETTAEEVAAEELAEEQQESADAIEESVTERTAVMEDV